MDFFAPFNVGFWLLLVVGLGLVGVLIYLRSRRSDD
jgi:hypothetical protein